MKSTYSVIALLHQGDFWLQEWYLQFAVEDRHSQFVASPFWPVHSPQCLSRGWLQFYGSWGPQCITIVWGTWITCSSASNQLRDWYKMMVQILEKFSLVAGSFRSTPWFQLNLLGYEGFVLDTGNGTVSTGKIPSYSISGGVPGKLP